MPELLSIDTLDWQLIVWSKDISQSQKLLSHTLNAREKKLPATCLRFDPILYLSDLDSRESEYTPSNQPLFFENKLYEFDFQFHPHRLSANPPTIKHRLQAIEDAFHFSGNSLRGSINFGNNIGWFKLLLNYQSNGKEIFQALSFEVLPTKMDIETDLSDISTIIDRQYPLLRFSFAQKTEHELNQSRKSHERFPLLWLSQFERLRLDLEKGVKQILQSPHSRLLLQSRTLKAEQLKGRLHPRLEEKIKSALKNGENHKHYRLDTKTLSLDTPENRFIKMVLTRCTQELSAFTTRVKANDVAPENNRISNTFFKQLNDWKDPLSRFLNRPIFREIEQFEGFNGESLVLHQKAGYTNVYRVWQQLKLYLDVFGQHASISMKSIAELYEVWCLLEVHRLLIDDLGFIETTSRKPSLYKKGVEIALHDGIGAAFHLERGNIKLRLAHEPLFKRNNDPKPGNIYSWTTSQKPDILLEAEFPNGEKIRWIFDAKYRISPDDNAIDYAPDDAINQMHRYRDALLHIHQADDGSQEKSRPIFGAFVLYPGWFGEDKIQNPYEKAIKEIGIGAFPLLPNSNNSWLKDFLIEQFGLVGNKYNDYKTRSSDHFYVQEAARINYSGLTSSKFKNLVLVVSLGPKRSKAYLNRFRNGIAKWYHTRESTTTTYKVQREIVRELKSCAFVVHFSDDKQRRIEYSYNIISVRLVKRKDISNEQAGSKTNPSNIEKNYWLFELGSANKLNSSINVSGIRDFKFRLININALEQATNWNELPNHYSFLQTT